MPAKPRAFKLSERVAWRKVDDEAVILDVETARYFTLRGAGLRLWEGLSEGRELGEIRNALLGEFDVKPSVLESDFERLLEALEAEGFLEAGKALPPSNGNGSPTRGEKPYRTPELEKHGTLSVEATPGEDITE